MPKPVEQGEQVDVEAAQNAIATAAALANEEGAALLYSDLHRADKTLTALVERVRLLEQELKDERGAARLRIAAHEYTTNQLLAAEQREKELLQLGFEAQERALKAVVELAYFVPRSQVWEGSRDNEGRA